MIKQNRKKGITLIEMVIYTGLLAFLSVLVINSSIYMYRTYIRAKTISDINQAATLSIERMNREIRDAQSIDTSSSVFGSNPGNLVLNSPTDAGGTESITFTLNENSQLTIQRDLENPVVLTPAHLEVSNLVFHQIMATSSQAVKVEMTIENTLQEDTISYNYYLSSVLRASY